MWDSMWTFGWGLPQLGINVVWLCELYKKASSNYLVILKLKNCYIWFLKIIKIKDTNFVNYFKKVTQPN